MNTSLFRKRSLEQINQPDQLNQAIEVITPSIWLATVAVIILLVGAITWALTAHVETSITSVGTVKNGVMSIQATEAAQVEEGMDVEVFGKIVGKVYSTDSTGKRNIVATVTNVPDGKYDVSIVLNRITPLSLLF